MLVVLLVHLVHFFADLDDGNNGQGRDQDSMSDKMRRDDPQIPDLFGFDILTYVLIYASFEQRLGTNRGNLLNCERTSTLEPPPTPV
jgi:hypothetical protein